jgi:hypothetical protein
MAYFSIRLLEAVKYKASSLYSANRN